jgi:site-specific recombinase XerD
MRLATAIENYIQHKRSLGMVYRVQEVMLRAFSKTAGDIDIARVSPETVRAFLDGTGPKTRFWSNKYGVLRGLYHYATVRQLVHYSPLPTTVPQIKQTFQPYIYTREDMERLLGALHWKRSPGKIRYLEPYTFRVLLLLLYGTGLRISEAVGLTLDDFDIRRRLLHIRETKFFKSRLVPLGSGLHRLLTRYLEGRHIALESGAPFFTTRLHGPVSRQLAEISFNRLRREARVCRPEPTRYQPRLHDFRHTFAVTRLIAWYRQGKDVQRLLPHLSTYLGHYDIASTQHYLTMTAELLGEANRRFEHYAQSEALHA